ncbi:hypothetical protein [Consotaella aegiceratis]|uniref:hypothetical protein n=1 Tax=Consotaella aegiceratis TaxID=3097961 RepID=UPI002F3FA85F
MPEDITSHPVPTSNRDKALDLLTRAIYILSLLDRQTQWSLGRMEIAEALRKPCHAAAQRRPGS